MEGLRSEIGLTEEMELVWRRRRRRDRGNVGDIAVREEEPKVKCRVRTKKR
uniref:Uncharacterized protein n=1 Tax=Cucumis sativus TaxID=3659 RepID=A0A0A0KIS1_CUCSA